MIKEYPHEATPNNMSAEQGYFRMPPQVLRNLADKIYRHTCKGNAQIVEITVER